MNIGPKSYSSQESSIFNELTLHSAVEYRNGRAFLVHRNGSISAIVPFEGMNNTALSEPEFEAMFAGIKKVIDDIPEHEGISVQFLMLRTADKEEMHAEILPTFLRPRAEYYNKLVENYQIFKNRFFLSILVPPSDEKKVDVVKKYFKNLLLKQHTEKHYFEKSMTDLEHRISVCSEMIDVFTNLFGDLHVNFKLLKTRQEYYDIIQLFTRPGKSKFDKITVDEEKESPRQALFSGVRAKVHRKDFTLDDYFHRIYTLDRAPKDYIYGKSIDLLESVPAEFIYSLTFKKMTYAQSINLFKWKTAEARMKSGVNESAIVEDRSLMANEKRVSDAYDSFVYGDAYGVDVSANFVLRLKEDYISKRMRELRLSRDEVVRRYDHMLTKRVFAKFGNSEWANEESTSWPVFCQLIPGHSDLNRLALKKMFLSTSELPYFIAMYDNARNLSHNGTNHFIDYRGNAIVFDLLDPSYTAWNYSISGQTGSGKSVLVNTILTTEFADAVKGKSPIICILDVGGDQGSYTKFMKLVGGEIINLSSMKKPHIQMLELVAERAMPTPNKIKAIADLFEKDGHISESMENSVRLFYLEVLSKGAQNLTDDDKKKIFYEVFGFEEKPDYREAMKLAPGECEPSPQQMNLIMALMEVVLSSNPKELDAFKNNFEYDEVIELIQMTYRRIEDRFPRLSDLYATAVDAIDESTQTGKRFLTKLKQWTKDGIYSMFDMETDVNLNNDVVLVDLKGLEHEHSLQMMYTLLFSQLFNDKMYFIRNRRKLMIRDEAWAILKNDRARRYFIEDLRTSRKNGFATILCTQSPTDVFSPSPADGKVILDQMQVSIICRVATDSIASEIGRELGLGQESIEMMKTLGVQKEVQEDGSYKATHSRFMMIVDGGGAHKQVYILKNLLDPFEYILYSSSAEDNAVINYYMQETRQFDDLEETLRYISNRRHIGDEKLAIYLDSIGQKNKAREVRGR